MKRTVLEGGEEQDHSQTLGRTGIQEVRRRDHPAFPLAADASGDLVTFGHSTVSPLILLIKQARVFNTIPHLPQPFQSDFMRSASKPVHSREGIPPTPFTPDGKSDHLGVFFEAERDRRFDQHTKHGVAAFENKAIQPLLTMEFNETGHQRVHERTVRATDPGKVQHDLGTDPRIRVHPSHSELRGNRTV